MSFKKRRKDKHSVINDLANANKSRGSSIGDMQLMRDNQFAKYQNDHLSSSDIDLNEEVKYEYETFEIEDLDKGGVCQSDDDYDYFVYAPDLKKKSKRTRVQSAKNKIGK